MGGAGSRLTPGLSPEERGLFEEAASGARPLAHDQHLPEPRYLKPLPISEREAEALRELDDLISGQTPFSLQQDCDQWLEGSVPGLDLRVRRQLAAGEFTLQGELDLHGVDSTSARGLLERFLLDAAARRLRCVRIIHGRGRGSPHGIPVLKRQIPRWLSRGPARHWVLAYSTAAPKDGGPGATYVLLRSKRPA